MAFLKTKRGNIRVISFALALALVITGCFIVNKENEKKLKRNIVHKYQASLEEISDGIYNMSIILDKTLYAGTPYSMASLVGELEMLSGTVEGALASFPENASGTEEIVKFANQVSDFSSVLLKKSIGGGKITNEERNSLKSLQSTAENISNNLDEAISVYNNEENWEKKVENILKDIKADDSFSVYINKMAETLNATPKLIYDGPFSDHIEDKESELLKKSKEISKENALEIGAKMLSVSNDALKSAGESEGKIPTFNFEGDEMYISVTKNGGYTSYFRKTREISQSLIAYEDAVGLAKDFLYKNVKEEFEATYYMTEENMCVINFATVAKDVIYYPDLIKVGVALDNGEIVFYEADGYIMNHINRNAVNFKVTPQEAEKSVSSYLKIQSFKPAVIPTGGKEEIVCYEFTCLGENDEKILVYINAETKAEENIFIVIETEGAVLTK